jgi:hypothetical protein
VRISFLGRYQLGWTVPLTLQVKDDDSAPSVPTNPPYAKVYLPDGAIFSYEMAVVTPGAVTGVFHFPLFLGPGFTAGQTRIVYTYRVGSDYGMDEDTLEIIPGGDDEGSVVAMHWYERPQARIVVQSLENGTIVSGRNPRL